MTKEIKNNAKRKKKQKKQRGIKYASQKVVKDAVADA